MGAGGLACYHCGLPVLEPGRFRARVLGAQRELCCAGCEAVARTIVEGGLEDYYRTRTEPAPPPAALADEAVAEAPVPGQENECSLILDRVRCSACLWLIERTLRRAPGVERADVNYATQRAHVAWKPGASLGPVIGALRAVGYDAFPYDPQVEAALARRKRRTELWRLFIAGFGAMQVMMYAFPAYVDGDAGTLGPDETRLMRWASLLITVPVLLFSCRPFFDGAWKELLQRRIGLDTPIALGVLGGFLASAWATVSGAGEVYFDSIAMLAFLLLAARFGEGAGRRRASALLDPLLRWSAAARSHPPGTLLQVAPGERVPADGVVEAGLSTVDESLLSGESRPLVKCVGDELTGGSVNLEQPLTLRVTRSGAQTRAAAIARLVERAAAAKPQLVERADRVARVLTYVVLATAAVAGFWSGDLWIPVAILVATCPCALGLAAPVVLTRAGGELLRRGALLTRSRALEALGRVSDVVLDKTGTLTTGQLAIAETVPLGSAEAPACLRLAASLEASSAHPIARAFRGALGGAEPRPVDEARNVPGEGIEGRIAGRLLRLGTARHCAGLCADARELPPRGGDTVVYLCDEAEWLAAFVLRDALRPDAAAMLEDFRARGLAVHLLSGDQPGAVAAVAEALAIGDWQAAVSPQGKFEYVERLQAAGRRVLMLGDGLNDAPVLARADVSVAMSSGAHAAQLQADLIVLGASLAPVRETLALASSAMRLVRQNLAWAVAYNALALPAAALGWIGPWEAALGMGASSLIVLFNALRPFGESPWKASTSSSRSRSFSYS